MFDQTLSENRDKKQMFIQKSEVRKANEHVVLPQLPINTRWLANDLR